MLYALIGSSLIGALAVAFLLWRKSVVETALAQCQGSLKASQTQAQELAAELTARQAEFTDKLSRKEAELTQAQKDLDNALKALPNGSVADLLRTTILPSDPTHSPK